MAGADLVCEYRFHPVRKWRFDFAFPSLRLAIEITVGVVTRQLLGSARIARSRTRRSGNPGQNPG